MKEKISITINGKILRDIDSLIDNLFIQNRSQAIEYLIKKAFKETKKAVILAGEPRFKKSDRIKNRYSLKVNHSTIIEKAIRKLSDSGFKTIYIIADNQTLTNIFKMIGDGSNFKVKIEYVNEENPEGTASALKLLKDKIRTTFLVVQQDLVFDHIDLIKLWQNHMKEKAVGTMLVHSNVIRGEETKYGYVDIDGNKVLSYDEKPLRSKLKSSIFFGGILVAEPELFSYPGKSLEHDVFPELAKKRLLGGLITSAEHLHIHTQKDLAEIRKKLQE